MGDFALELKNFAKHSERKMNLVAKKSAIELFADIIKSTPVDQGRLKGNWQPAINKFDDSTTENTDKSRQGQHSASSKAKLVNELNSFELGDTMTLSNNLPYARRIEFEGWSKTKAPAGMVRINVIRWQQHLDEQARKLK